MSKKIDFCSDSDDVQVAFERELERRDISCLFSLAEGFETSFGIVIPCFVDSFDFE